MIKSYQDLIVWQKSVELVLEIYRLTNLFPKSELYGLVSQIRRAATSIPANIAEGFARKSRKEYKQFCLIAYGSGAELETHLIIAKKLALAHAKEFEPIEMKLQEIMRMLNGLIHSLNTSG